MSERQGVPVNELRIETQTELVRAALEAGERITALDALRRWGCFRLGARIFDLKKEGLAITKEMVRRGDAYVAEYRLVKEEQA
jgi:hypothetical protein